MFFDVLADAPGTDNQTSILNKPNGFRTIIPFKSEMQCLECNDWKGLQTQINNYERALNFNSSYSP